MQLINQTSFSHSGNDKHSSESEFNKQKTIGVKYAIYIALIRLVLYSTFLYRNNNNKKSLSYTVILSFSFFIFKIKGMKIPPSTLILLQGKGIL